MSHRTLQFSGAPFLSHLGRRRRFFLKLFVIFSHCRVLLFDTFGPKPSVKGGKFNPGNLPMYVSSCFNALSIYLILFAFRVLSAEIYFSSAGKRSFCGLIPQPFLQVFYLLFKKTNSSTLFV